MRIRTALTQPGDPKTLPLFVLGLLSPLFIPVGGQLYISEVACLGYFIVTLARPNPPSLRRWYWGAIQVAGATAVLAYFVSSFWNVTPVAAAASAAVSIIVFLVSIRVLASWISDFQSALPAIVGLALGEILVVPLQPQPEFSEAPWKFGYSLPVALIVCALLDRANRLTASIAALVILAVLNILGDYRSMGIFLLLALAVAIGQRILLRRQSLLRARLRDGYALAVLAGVALIVGIALAQLYTVVVSSGVLGANAESRLRLQGGGSPLLMLLGGRNEIFSSLPAALANPVLGYGADNVAPSWVSDQARETLIRLGLPLIAAEPSAGGSIPTHSFIMSSWIEGGLAAVAIWILVLGLLIRALNVETSSRVIRILPSFLIIYTVWNVFFSPFGATTRFLTAIVVAAALGQTVQSHSAELRRQDRLLKHAGPTSI